VYQVRNRAKCLVLRIDCQETYNIALYRRKFTRRALGLSLGAVLKSLALVAGFDDIAVMSESSVWAKKNRSADTIDMHSRHRKGSLSLGNLELTHIVGGSAVPGGLGGNDAKKARHCSRGRYLAAGCRMRLTGR